MAASDIALGSTEVSPAPLHRAHRSTLLKRQMPGLDTLRGLAVLSVVLLHGLKLTQPPSLAVSHGVDRIVSVVTGGWLGVTLFFVLSGFLITGILLDTRTRENYWRSFYVRRVLRILPMYLVTIVFVTILFGLKWQYVLLCLIFAANLADCHMYTYGPFWSLAVEEQFYLFWPLLVKRLRLRTLGMICIGSLVVSPVLRILSGYYPLGNPYVSTWLISDCLLLGAFIAIFLRSRHSSPKNVLRLTVAMGLLGLAILAVCLRFHWLNRASVMGSALESEPFLYLFGCLLMLALYFGDHPTVLWLTRPLHFFGYISYGLYLVHWAFFILFNSILYKFLPPWKVLTVPILLAHFIPYLTVVCLICYLSRRYFEEYFLQKKDKLVPYTKPHGSA
jgi:peptidoglycan/LPS O-acetylase OafA/YrhL